MSSYQYALADYALSGPVPPCKGWVGPLNGVLKRYKLQAGNDLKGVLAEEKHRFSAGDTMDTRMQFARGMMELGSDLVPLDHCQWPNNTKPAAGQKFSVQWYCDPRNRNHRVKEGRIDDLPPAKEPICKIQDVRMNHCPEDLSCSCSFVVRMRFNRLAIRWSGHQTPGSEDSSSGH